MITKDVFEKTNTTDRDLTWLISEFFANIEWIEICFIWYETVDDNIKVSFRSSPNYDISKICSYFWWWWHKQAAWFTSNKSLKETEKNILYKINETLWNN
jgi:nanoRNase/pAp phosphatase (c-di-AMP/oligoRNAs hydrolase)